LQICMISSGKLPYAPFPFTGKWRLLLHNYTLEQENARRLAKEREGIIQVIISPLAPEVFNPRLEKTSVFQTRQLELTPLSSELVRVSGEGLGVR